MKVEITKTPMNLKTPPVWFKVVQPVAVLIVGRHTLANGKCAPPDRLKVFNKEHYMADKNTIRLSRLINHPPAKVWRALTDPEIHARWWAAGDVKAEVGHRFTLDMGEFGQQPCEVLAVEPGRLLRYSFAPGTLDTTITWRLEPESGGTRLHLEHSGFDPDSPLGKMAFEGMSHGWPGVLERIDSAIESSLGDAS